MTILTTIEIKNNCVYTPVSYALLVSLLCVTVPLLSHYCPFSCRRRSTQMFAELTWITSLYCPILVSLDRTNLELWTWHWQLPHLKSGCFWILREAGVLWALYLLFSSTEHPSLPFWNQILFLHTSWTFQERLLLWPLSQHDLSHLPSYT